MAKIVVLITSDDVLDPDYVPTYENDTTAFYWGAFEDSPSPNQRVLCLLDNPATREEAHQLARLRLS